MAAIAEVVEAARREGVRPVVRRAIRTGLVGGLVGVYLAAVGLVERFNGANIITGVLTLGPTFLFLTMVATGYFSARDRKVEGIPVPLSAGERLLGGLLSGTVLGLVIAGFVLLFNAVNLRDVFPNFSPILFEDILTFGQSAGLGAILQIVVGVGLGVVGATLHFLRPPDRRVLLAGVLTVLLVGVLEQLIRVMLGNVNLQHEWLYTRGGLTIPGAVIIFVLGAGIAFLSTRRDAILNRFAGVRGRTATRADDSAARAVQEGPRDAAPVGAQDNMAVGLGLASLALAVTLALMSILQVAFNPSFLVVSLVVGIAAVGFTSVMVRRRTGGAARATTRAGRAGIGFFAALAGIFIIVPPIVGAFLSQALVTVGIYVLLGLGLNIVVGYAGLLDLGYVAFFAVGAYAMGLFTALQSSLVTKGVGEFGAGSQPAAENPFTNFWIALPIVVVVAVIIGLFIGAPVLRLRGDYLAIVTLGFGEIVRVVVGSDWAAPVLGGSQGIKQIEPPPPEAFDFRNPQNLYYLVLLFCLLAAYISWRLQYSRVGRAWAAMREDEDVAEAMGVSVVKYKLLAFAMGAAVGCLSGAFFAVNLSVITPRSFLLLVSITVLAAIILGGLGNIPGVIVGSVFLVGLPEILRDFAEYRLLFYGAILVGIMILRPEGLIASARRKRELHERAEEEILFAKEAAAAAAAPVVTGGAGGGEG